jgi:hypothetical protein
VVILGKGRCRDQPQPQCASAKQLGRAGQEATPGGQPSRRLLGGVVVYLLGTCWLVPSSLAVLEHVRAPFLVDVVDRVLPTTTSPPPFTTAAPVDPPSLLALRNRLLPPLLCFLGTHAGGWDPLRR